MTIGGATLARQACRGLTAGGLSARADRDARAGKPPVAPILLEVLKMCAGCHGCAVCNRAELCTAAISSAVAPTILKLTGYSVAESRAAMMARATVLPRTT
jgi:hypothetical protein